MVWLTGGALAVSLLMIVTLLTWIVYQGGATFWPDPVLFVEMKSDVADQPSLLMGEITREEIYELNPAILSQLPENQRTAAEKLLAEGQAEMRRQLLRSGNFELTGTHFHWLDDYNLLSKTTPKWAMLLEREVDGLQVGRFYGLPRSITIDGEVQVDASTLTGEEKEAAQQQIWEVFQEHHPAVVARREEIVHKERYEIGDISYRVEQSRLKMRSAELASGKDSPEYKEAAAAYAKLSETSQTAFGKIQEEIEALRAENEKFVLTLDAPNGGPELIEHPIDIANIVRMFPANNLGLGEKLQVYASRWVEFLFSEPREANSEGGVWPAIVGTVTLTMIMAIAVVPFGVLAALYLKEYAKPGPIVSAVRIAINNLAGVPSIVFGVFGLHFFCYGVGSGIDSFFFPASVADGNPVYGKGALVWASFTLALLTLPVVIVAAEEALSAVPNSMREGSYACGAGKWQTLRRIVLPRAMPGIMTGMILAMARGAGEVAPLMLVGAVKVAPDLVLDGTFPFIHPDRSFLHLGFQIYDVGLQSPNSEAAKPMVYTTTLLLIVLIAVLNLTAIWLRQRLSRKFHTNHI